jgi:hypothetical protein
MPGLLRFWPVWVLAAALLLVPFFVKIPKSLNNHPVVGPFGDQLHVVLLGGLTFLIYWVGPLRGRVWAAAGLAVVIGAAIEFVQIPFGRTALLKDFLLDLLGIGLATAFILWRGHGRSRAGIAFLVLLLVLPAQMWRLPFVAAAASRNRDTFPVIADFEGRWDGMLWGDNMDARLEVVAIEDGPDGPTQVLQLTGAPPIHWPGAIIRRFPRDWTGYTTLAAEVRLVSGPEANGRLGLRLDDVEGVKEKAWISKGFDIGPAWTTVTFRFAGARLTWGSGRAFDHTDLEKILFYLPKPAGETVVEIDDVRLLSGNPTDPLAP